jgi:hypothetical protein
LVWDSNADVDALLEELFVKYYGPAADPMRRFWLAAERHYATQRPGTDVSRRVASQPEFWTELDGYLKEAQAATASADQRFRDRVDFNRVGFDLGREMWEFEARYMPRRGTPNPNTTTEALAALKEAEPRYEALKAKYSPSDEYWPTLLPVYFWPDFKDLRDRVGVTAGQ